MIGIYCIKNKIDCKVYVGQSVEIEKRINRHKRELKNNIHHNKYLQRTWNKYGESAFAFEILEKCKREELNNKETWWKNYFDNVCGTYNLGNTGNVQTTSEETRLKISKTLKEKHYQVWLGRHHTKETKEKMSISNKGKSRPHTPEEIEKMRIANLGKKRSEETRKKISEIRKGKKLSQEQLAKRKGMFLGTANPFYGKHHTEETKEKLRQKRLGVKLNNDTKKKISEGNKGRVGYWRGKKLPQETVEKCRLSHQKKINQFDLNKVFIKQWNSIKEASQTLNINENSICRVCKKFRNKAGNYYWEYAE